MGSDAYTGDTFIDIGIILVSQENQEQWFDAGMFTFAIICDYSESTVLASGATDYVYEFGQESTVIGQIPEIIRTPQCGFSLWNSYTVICEDCDDGNTDSTNIIISNDLVLSFSTDNPEPRTMPFHISVILGNEYGDQTEEFSFDITIEV